MATSDTNLHLHEETKAIHAVEVALRRAERSREKLLERHDMEREVSRKEIEKLQSDLISLKEAELQKLKGQR